MTRTYVVTGATGFLGSRLSVALLQQGHTLIFLGRSLDGISLKERLIQKFAILGYTADSRLIETVEEDIATVNHKAFGSKRIDGVWHLAANLSFKKADRDAVYRTNIEGMKRMAELASHFNTTLFYVSTAYVHGKRTGLLLEDELIRPSSFNNSYEESKFIAEDFLRKWAKNNRMIVFRPGILIETRNFPAPYFGYYVIVASLHELKVALYTFVREKPLLAKLLGVQIISKTLSIPLSFPNSRRCTLDLVPVVWVVEWMLTLSELSPAVGKTFHLTNPHPFPFHQVILETFAALEISMPVLSMPAFFVRLYFKLIGFVGLFSYPLASLARKISFYESYMVDEYLHDMRNVKELLGDLSRYHIERGTLTSVARRFSQHLRK